MTSMAWLVVGISPLAPQDRTPLDLAQAIITAHEANRAVITHARIEFRYSVGTTRAVDDAMAGRWSDRTDGRGVFVLDGERARYDQVFSLDDSLAKRQKTGGNSYSSPFASVRAVTDGRSSLMDRIAIGRSPEGAEVLSHRPQVVSGADPFFSVAQMPLFLARPGPAPDLSKNLGDAIRGQAGGKLGKVAIDSRLDGVEVAEVTIDWPDRAWTRYWIDLKRGAIPLQSMSEWDGGKSTAIDRYDDVREVPGGAWYPFRWVRINGARVVEMTVTKADFEVVPDPSEFRLSFPASVSLIDMVAMREYAPKQTWDVTRLPAPNSEGSLPIRGPDREPPPAMPGELEPFPTSAVLAAVAGSILLTLALLQYRRRSHGRSVRA